MGLPEIFSTTQTDGFEQTLMMTTFELTSWLVAFVALMTIIIAVMGIIHLIKSEQRPATSADRSARNVRAVRRVAPARKRNLPALELVHRTTSIR